MGLSCQFVDVCSPRFNFLYRNLRLSQMVECEWLVRMAIYKANRCRQLPLKYKQIVGQTVVAKQSYPAVEIVSIHVSVLFALQHVPDAFQAICAKLGECFFKLRIVKRNPANHAFDPGMPFRQAQQPLCLLKRLPGLNRDRAMHASLDQGRLQIVGQKVSPDGCHRVVNPAKLRVRIAPEMLMSVDPPACCWNGHKASPSYRLTHRVGYGIFREAGSLQVDLSR